jgi:hypothetical protein
MFAKNRCDNVITTKAPLITPKNTIRVANIQPFQKFSNTEQYENPKSIWKYEMGNKNTTRNI